MDQLILASECDVVNEVICAPADVKELFEFTEPLLTLGTFPITKTILLMFLAAFIVIALLHFGLRKRSLIPGKFEMVIESSVEFVRDGVGRDVIGPEGVKYVPYLL